MDFYELNHFIKSAPEAYHWAASGLILTLFTHLAIAYKMVRCRLRRGLRAFLTLSYFIVLFLFFGKWCDSGYTMLDIFLPLYFIYYILVIIAMQARFFNCYKEGKFSLFDFNSEPLKNTKL